VIHVAVRRHRIDGRCGVLIGKLSIDVGLPKAFQLGLSFSHIFGLTVAPSISKPGLRVIAKMSNDLDSFLRDKGAEGNY